MLKQSVRFIGYVALAWFLGNLALILASWGRSYFTPIEPLPQIASIDLRTDKSRAGRVVSIIATRPTPSKADYIGHMWVAWPQTPPLAPSGSKEGGYYADNQLQAAVTLAGAIWAPWGFATGQTPVGGHMKVDDGWWRHKEVRVLVNEDRYQVALKVDTKWRTEKRYSLRPGVAGIGQGRTWACQDYVLEVAGALGLKTGQRNWTQFPMGSFMDFIKLNEIAVTTSN
jgi:hypothetical protein